MKCFILITAVFFSNYFLIAQQNLSIEISCNKPNFIQGEFINVQVKITNNTNRSIKTDAPKYYIHNSKNDSTYSNQHGYGYIIIPPQSTYYFLLDPQQNLIFSGIDFSTHTLFPGSYNFYLSLTANKEYAISNKIHIKIEPVPDSLKSDFDKLKFTPGRINTVEDYERLYEEQRVHIMKKNFYTNC
jgi:hypothetical protein